MTYISYCGFINVFSGYKSDLMLRYAVLIYTIMYEYQYVYETLLLKLIIKKYFTNSFSSEMLGAEKGLCWISSFSRTVSVSFLGAFCRSSRVFLFFPSLFGSVSFFVLLPYSAKKSF